MKTLKLIILLIFTINQAQALGDNRISTRFMIRTLDSSVPDYVKALNSSGLISYTEWLLRESEKKQVQLSQLDEALEMVSKDPLGAYTKLKSNVESFKKDLLNTKSRELIASTLIRMSELAVPLRMQELARCQAVELIGAHPSLLEAAEFKSFFDNGCHQPSPILSKYGSRLIEQRELGLLKTKKDHHPGLEDSIFLMDGEVQSWDSFEAPRGEHQWALLSNAFSPLIVFGSWDQFTGALAADDTLKPLTDPRPGTDCDRPSVITNDFQVQTLAQVFRSSSCLKSLDKQADPIGKPTEETNQKSNSVEGWVTAGLILIFAGGLALKDKKVAVKLPSFK